MMPGANRRGYWNRRTLAGAAHAALAVLRNSPVYPFAGSDVLRPLYVVWHVTLRCNLACTFCDDGTGAGYPERSCAELSTSDSLALLELIRETSSSIYFTGGEPFVRKDFPLLVKRSRELGFWPVFVNTNGSLREPLEPLLEEIDVLVVSLGSTDGARHDIVLGGRPGQTAQTMENLKRCAAAARARGRLRVVVNCVLCAGRVADARSVLSFCQEQGLWFSPAPALRGDRVDPQLLKDPEYDRLVTELLEARRAGAAIYGSPRQLEVQLRARPFHCYPALTPRVYPNGDLFRPCQPLHRSVVNVLEQGSFQRAWRLHGRRDSQMASCGNRCHLPCYVSNSQWKEHPMEMVVENARVIWGSRPRPRQREAP